MDPADDAEQIGNSSKFEEKIRGIQIASDAEYDISRSIRDQANSGDVVESGGSKDFSFYLGTSEAKLMLWEDIKSDAAASSSSSSSSSAHFQQPQSSSYQPQSQPQSSSLSQFQPQSSSSCSSFSRFQQPASRVKENINAERGSVLFEGGANISLLGAEELDGVLAGDGRSIAQKSRHSNRNSVSGISTASTLGHSHMKDLKVIAFRYGQVVHCQGWLIKRGAKKKIKGKGKGKDKDKEKLLYGVLEGQVLTLYKKENCDNIYEVVGLMGATVYGFEKERFIKIQLKDSKRELVLSWEIEHDENVGVTGEATGSDDSDDDHKSDEEDVSIKMKLSDLGEKKLSKTAKEREKLKKKISRHVVAKSVVPDPSLSCLDEYRMWFEALKRGTRKSIHDYYNVGTKILGKGAFGEVVLGNDIRTGQIVAIKILAKDPEFKRVIELVIREMRISSRLCHPRTIRTYDIFDSEDRLYIIMEYMPGGNLYELFCRKGNFSERELKSTIQSILEGVEHLHQQNIVHRDLNLKNLLIRDDKFPLDLKIADFGLSNFLPPGERFTGLHSHVGSPYYTAPEMISPTYDSYGNMVDMWSVGVITYALYCGVFPFFGDTVAETLVATVKNELKLHPSFVRASSELVDFVKGLLKKNPHERLTVEKAIRHPFLMT